MKRIALLTSGGDTAGMNAAIRAVVRTGLDNGWEVYGIRYGYGGLIAGDFLRLGAREVGGIIQLGGTMLRSGRCLEFKTEAGRNQALRNLRQKEIEGLIVIGGDGSQTGAYLLSQTGFPVIGVASTIDNDLYGSEITIGVDTALNVALESIDRLKVTASSHQRARYNAQALLAYFREHKERLGFELRVTTLGHVQRGGAPGAFDRLLATRFGVAAVRQLETKEHGVLIGLQNGAVLTTTLKDVTSQKKTLDLKLLKVAQILAH